MPMNLLHVVRHLIRLAEAHGLGVDPWSLGEVLRGDETYHLLVQWAGADSMPLHKTLCSSLSEDLSFRGGRITQREGYGLALLALACEQGRRHASAGSIWPAFASLSFHREARSRLLSPIDQPTVGFKDAIEAAVRRFRLRNIVGDQDKHRWATTVFLQFGLPLASLERLPEWLAAPSVAPDAVRMLLSPDGGSPAFQQDWLALQRAARGHTRDQLARSLSRSPWFGWSPEAARLAREAALRPRPTAASVQAVPQPSPEPSEGAIVGEPHYRTDSPRARPSFDCPLLPLASTEDQPGVLDLYVNGVRQVRLIRAPGGYQPLDGLSRRPLPEALESVVVLLETDQRQVSEAQQIWLLGPQGQAVAVYDARSGDRVEGPLRHDASYVLVLAPNAEVHGDNVDVVPFGEGSVAYLDAPWSDVEVRVQDAVVWRGHASAAPVRTTWSAPRHAPGLELLGPGGWRRVTPNEVVDRHALETTSVRVHLPEEWGRASLVAGDAYLCASPRRAARLSRLPGLGEPLMAVEGSSFADPVARTLPLIASVVDHGCVRSLEGDVLSLEPPWRWGDGFHTLVWPNAGPVQVQTPVAMDPEGTRVRMHLEDRPRAVAVMYGSSRVGAWWREDWSSDLALDPASARRALLCARFMRLPLRASPHRERLQVLADQNLALAYGAWVRPDPAAVLDGLTFELDPTVAWVTTARAVLYDCALTRERRSAVDSALDGASVTDFGRDYAGLKGVGAAVRLRRFLVLEVGPQHVLEYHYHSAGPAGHAEQSQWYFLGESGKKGGHVKRRLLSELLHDVKHDLALNDEDRIHNCVRATTQWSGTARALGIASFRVFASVFRLDEVLKPGRWRDR